MGIYEWVCKNLCSREIAAAAERLRLQQEQELEEMKTEAARRADPEKIHRHAARALDKLTGVGLVAALFMGCAGGQVPAGESPDARVSGAPGGPVSELIVAVAGVIVLTAAIIALVYTTEARMRGIAAEQRRIILDHEGN